MRLPRQGSTLFLALLLGGCASAPVPRQGLPANAAVLQGLDQLFEQSSYRTRISMHVSPEPAGDNAAGVSGQDSSDSSKPPSSALPPDANWPLVVNSVGAFMRRMALNVDMVTDLRHKQLQMDARLDYSGHNTGAYVRVPLLLDFDHGQGYVDLSALSPFAASPDNDGKFSRFSLQALLDRVDPEKIYAWLHVVEHDANSNVDPALFQDVALSNDDIAQGGQRKVLLKTTMGVLSDAVRRAHQAHQAELDAALKPRDAAAAKNELVDAVIKGLTDSSGMGGLHQLPEMDKFLASNVEITFLLDARGRLLQQDNRYSYATGGPRPLKFSAELQSRYSDYGTARIEQWPDSSGTVELDANFKSSMFGAIMAADHARVAQAKEAGGNRPPTASKESPLVGTWQSQDGGSCHSTYYVINNYSALIVSGENVRHSMLMLAPQPSQRGFYRINRSTFADNGRPDCSGQAEAKTSYIQFDASKSRARICVDETLAHCELIERVPEAGH